jgi:cyanophycin synthetase
MRAGLNTGLVCTEGLFHNSRRIDATLPSDWEAGQRVLMNRNIQAAVIENSPRSILDDGLSYDRCQVGVVTSVPFPQGLQDHHILTQDQMRNVLRTQIDVVLPNGSAVLNSDDPSCVALAEVCDGDVIFYGSKPATEANHETRPSARQVTLQGNNLVLVGSGKPLVLLDLAQPAVVDLLAKQLPLPALMAAVAVGIAMEVPQPVLRAGIETAQHFIYNV